MTVMFTRMFALMTIASYLLVGTVAVRLFTAKNAQIGFSLDYFSILQNGSIETAQMMDVKAPEQVFADIKFPVKAAPVVAKVSKPAKIARFINYKPSKTTLPFHGPIVLEKVLMTTHLPKELIALYKAAPEEIAEMVAKAPAANVDEISTKMASAVDRSTTDAEPTFLDYSKDEVKEEPFKNEEIAKAEVAVASHLTETENVEAVDKGRGAVDKGRGAVENVVNNSTEEVIVDDLIAFDYPSIKKDVVENKMPIVTNVTTQVAPKVTIQAAKTVTPPKAGSPVNSQKEESNGLMAPAEKKAELGYPSEVNVHAAGTNLKKSYDLKGFEVRFQDDLSETLEDYGSGAVTMKTNLAQPSMTRSIVILKKGFAPTNTDLIVENGAFDDHFPLIEEEVFNELIAPYEARGVVGALLVELDDETESSKIDVPYGEVLNLDADLRPTKKDDYRYQLYMGVKAGNALVSYKDTKGRDVNKIVHIHERELTYESNRYENVSNEKLTLFEEGLLSREKSPLIIGAGHVKKFASDIESRKISDHVYKVSFERHLVANRRYVEISHLDEPIFVGVRDVSKVAVPSEHFMRFVLSKNEDGKLGNRCLVQVNLSKKVEKIEVASESVANSLFTQTQMLDNDGKFYDSASDKTRKVIIVGEDQGAPEYSKEAKINLKINYVDGSVQFLSSYCSPNSYLVEQL